MKKISYTLFLVVILSSMVLTGCLKPASTAPTAIVTVTLTGPYPAVTKPPIKEIFSSTQTAAALASAEPKTGPTATQEKVEPTRAPTLAKTITPTAVIVPTLARPKKYTLKQDEFPYCIARRYNLDPGELLSANGLGNNSHSPAGTVLKIPDSIGPWNEGVNGPRALHTHTPGASYTVKAGETLYSIACYFGDVDPAAIAAASGLKEPYSVTVGQKLIIP